MTAINKETVYDEQISPLMAQIIDICEKNGIAMLATFDIPTPEDSGLCCTSVLPDETGRNPVRQAAAMSVLEDPRFLIGMLATIKPIDKN